MSDLVIELRRTSKALQKLGGFAESRLYDAAADEIERLQDELNEARGEAMGLRISAHLD